MPNGPQRQASFPDYPDQRTDTTSQNGNRSGLDSSRNAKFETVWVGRQDNKNGLELFRRRIDLDPLREPGPRADPNPERLYNANAMAIGLGGEMPTVPSPLQLMKNLAPQILKRHPAVALALGIYSGMQFFARATDKELSDIAREFGLALDTLAGRKAAAAFKQARPQDGDWQRTLGEAGALLELMDPGLSERVDPAARLKWNDFMSRAITAAEEGRLRPDGHGFSRDWVGSSILTEEERRLLERSPGFSYEERQKKDFVLADPLPDVELPNHTGQAAEEVVPPDNGVIADPIPEVQGPNVLTSRPEDSITPGGNVIGAHGAKGTGKEYITLKGHTPEQIDDIVASPRPELSGVVAGKGRYKNEEMILLTGEDGHWALLDPSRRVVAVSNRNLPLRDSENRAPEIVRPLEGR